MLHLSNILIFTFNITNLPAGLKNRIKPKKIYEYKWTVWQLFPPFPIKITLEYTGSVKNISNLVWRINDEKISMVSGSAVWVD